MAEFKLARAQFLNGYRNNFGSADLSEVTDLNIASLACPIGGEADLRDTVSEACGFSLPAPGSTSGSLADGMIMIGLSQDQWFAMTEGDSANLDRLLAAISKTAYCTDQSDNWAALRLTGSSSVAALQRLCPIDVHPPAFQPGAMARTVMHHLGVIILCEGKDRYLLISGSSSAKSFLHAIDTAVQSVT